MTATMTARMAIEISNKAVTQAVALIPPEKDRRNCRPPPNLVNEGAYPARGIDRSCSHFLSQRVKLQIEPPPFDAGILLVALLSLAAKGIGQP